MLAGFLSKIGLSALLFMGNVPFVAPTITNNIGSAITVSQQELLKNLSFEYSEASESGTIVTSNIGYNDLSSHTFRFNSNTNLHCTQVNGSVCQVYSWSNSATSLGQVTFSEDSQSIRLALNDKSSIIFSQPRYSYTKEYIVSIAFTDYKKHSGRMKIDEWDDFYCDSNNVSVIGNYIYFYDVGSFTIHRESEFVNTTLTNTGSINLTLDDLVLRDESDDLYSLVESFMSAYTVNNIDFPLESYIPVYYCFNKGYSLSRVFGDYGYKFPAFNLSKGNTVFETPSGANRSNYYFIFGINQNIYNADSFSQYFTLENFTLSEFKSLDRVALGNTKFTLGKVLLYRDTASGERATISANNSFEYMPIFINYASSTFISNDFADLFGIDKRSALTNSLDNSNNDFSSQANQLITFEQSQKQNFQQQLQNINFTFDGNQFNQSATFYKKVFTDFIGSTPLFVPLSVVLTLALAMIILGYF